MHVLAISISSENGVIALFKENNKTLRVVRSQSCSLKVFFEVPCHVSKI